MNRFLVPTEYGPFDFPDRLSRLYAGFSFLLRYRRGGRGIRIARSLGLSRSLLNLAECGGSASYSPFTAARGYRHSGAPRREDRS